MSILGEETQTPPPNGFDQSNQCERFENEVEGLEGARADHNTIINTLEFFYPPYSSCKYGRGHLQILWVLLPVSSASSYFIQNILFCCLILQAGVSYHIIFMHYLNYEHNG